MRVFNVIGLVLGLLLEKGTSAENPYGLRGRVLSGNDDSCASVGNFRCGPKKICQDQPAAIGGGYSCVGCREGYDKVDTVAGSFNCIDRDECRLDSPCADFAFCVDWDPSKRFVCKCLPGFRGEGLKGTAGCLDIDECKEGIKLGKTSEAVNCGPNASCENMMGSYKCVCDENFEKNLLGVCVPLSSSELDQPSIDKAGIGEGFQGKGEPGSVVSSDGNADKVALEASKPESMTLNLCPETEIKELIFDQDFNGDVGSGGWEDGKIFEGGTNFKFLGPFFKGEEFPARTFVFDTAGVTQVFGGFEFLEIGSWDGISTKGDGFDQLRISFVGDPGMTDTIDLGFFARKFREPNVTDASSASGLVTFSMKTYEDASIATASGLTLPSQSHWVSFVIPKSFFAQTGMISITFVWTFFDRQAFEEAVGIDNFMISRCIDTVASSSPSSSPTVDISTNPSMRPSDVPTRSPEPSSMPSNTPTRSPEPSSMPSDTPTRSPEPSGMPSDTPTRSPEPSSMPSDTPTRSPEPSGMPSDVPTRSPEPSSMPSDTPTRSPEPSSMPSDTPTRSPEPSSMPSDTPTRSPEPSSMPSDTPTRSPEPSSMPSDLPTRSPAPSSCPRDVYLDQNFNNGKDDGWQPHTYPNGKNIDYVINGGRLGQLLGPLSSASPAFFCIDPGLPGTIGSLKCPIRETFRVFHRSDLLSLDNNIYRLGSSDVARPDLLRIHFDIYGIDNVEGIGQYGQDRLQVRFGTGSFVDYFDVKLNGGRSGSLNSANSIAGNSDGSWNVGVREHNVNLGFGPFKDFRYRVTLMVPYETIANARDGEFKLEFRAKTTASVFDEFFAVDNIHMVWIYACNWYSKSANSYTADWQQN